MATILLRMKFSEQSKLAAGRGRTGLKEAIPRLCEQLGDFKFLNLFSSLSEGEMVAQLEGPAERVMVLHQVLNWSGAFDHVRSEILIPSEDMSGYRPIAEDLAADFAPPNRDEIDRMLLEE